MNDHAFLRTEMLIGKDALNKLATKTVAIFGLGGVGSYVVEGLVRTGVESFVLVDSDVVSITNINRQIIATSNNIGVLKTIACQERIKAINPQAKVKVYSKRFSNESLADFSFIGIDYIVDAIDIVSDKILLIETAKKHQIPIISCMGTGNKLDPLKFQITDISKTHSCPLAKVMRKELKDRNIKNVKVLFSTETNDLNTVLHEKGRHAPASISFTPAIAGLLIAREVILDLII